MRLLEPFCSLMKFVRNSAASIFDNLLISSCIGRSLWLRLLCVLIG